MTADVRTAEPSHPGMVGAAPPFADVALARPVIALGLHALALVPVSGTASLWSRAYRDWLRGSAPALAEGTLDRDGRHLAPAVDGAALRALQWLPLLHQDLATLRAAATTDLAALPASPARDALRAVANQAELLRAGMALDADAFLRAWTGPWRAVQDAAIPALAPWLDAAIRTVAPSLAHVPIRLAPALASRGRGFPGMILVGVPGIAGAETRTVAVVALHEHFVREAAHEAPEVVAGDEAPTTTRSSAAQRAWAYAEWRALREVSRRLAETSDPMGVGLRQAHTAWVAGLEIADLVAGARALSLVDEATATALLNAPNERTQRLADLTRTHRS